MRFKKNRVYIILHFSLWSKETNAELSIQKKCNRHKRLRKKKDNKIAIYKTSVSTYINTHWRTCSNYFSLAFLILSDTKESPTLSPVTLSI